MSDNSVEYKTEQYLKEFYDLSNTTDIKGFYYETRLHSVIVLEISLASFNKNHPVSFEYLCETIPKKLGKRTTIQTILNEGLRKGYFLKTLNEKDKRIKFYTLEKNSLEIIEINGGLTEKTFRIHNLKLSKPSYIKALHIKSILSYLR